MMQPVLRPVRTRRRTEVVVALLMAISALSSCGSDSAEPAGGGSGISGDTVFDLAVIEVGEAEYQGSTGTILSTGESTSRVLLPALAAAPPDGRQIEVDLITPPDEEIRLVITWYEGDESDPTFIRSKPVQVAPSAELQQVAVDLSAMSDTVGPVRVRFDGAPGSVIHRIALVEGSAGSSVDAPSTTTS